MVDCGGGFKVFESAAHGQAIGGSSRDPSLAWRGNRRGDHQFSGQFWLVDE